MLNDLFDGLKFHAHSGGQPQLAITFGELATYYPDTHQGVFKLPLHIDDQTGEPIDSGPIPIGTFWTGPGYGAQFIPCLGAQALVVYVDAARVMPVAAVLLFNQVETPPYPQGDFSGLLDQYGNALKWSKNRSALVAPTALELGSENLDSSADAVVTKRHLDERIQALVSELKTWGNVSFQAGTNAAAGPTLANSAAGSSKVRAVY